MINLQDDLIFHYCVFLHTFALREQIILKTHT